jgi:site-specific DNA-methyltransferase (adenine-specific)
MSTPYYQDDLVTLYHGDCLEVTEWLAADVLVTDPPYGQAYKSGRGNASSLAARSIANDESTAVRDAALALWGDRPRIVFEGRDVVPLKSSARLVWHKPGSGMGDLAMPWKPDYEFVSVSGRGFSGARDTSVLTYPLRVFRGDLEHPHMKPQGLMEALIDKCPPGVIADPFAGSGSTLLAARNLGRATVGVELEERYCEQIARRVSQQSFDLEGIA